MFSQAKIIIEQVSKEFDVPVKKITGKGRSKTVLEARKHAIQRCRVFTELSLCELGIIFGKRDHSTIMRYLNPQDIH